MAIKTKCYQWCIITQQGQFNWRHVMAWAHGWWCRQTRRLKLAQLKLPKFRNETKMYRCEVLDIHYKKTQRWKNEPWKTSGSLMILEWTAYEMSTSQWNQFSFKNREFKESENTQSGGRRGSPVPQFGVRLLIRPRSISTWNNLAWRLRSPHSFAVNLIKNV